MRRTSLVVLATLILLWVVMGRGIGAQPVQVRYDPNSLSYGIYWFGLNNASQKFVPGEANPYFDPSKPTVIFVHGWQPGLSASHPPNFTYTYTEGFFPKQVNTANAWIQAGWNVGIFYWNQFSDEALVTDAEAKIWTPNGPKGMRWRRGDGSYADAPPGTPSAGELFFQEYVAALTEVPYTGRTIRIAGHSLGGQMAVRVTYLLEQAIARGDVPATLRPTRVALLDPYWSPGPKPYLEGKTTAEMVRRYVAELLPSGVLFEWYRSSSLTLPPQGDANDAMQPMMLYAEMNPAYVPDAMSKHIAARHLYFWSYAFSGPAGCSGDACLNIDRLLARMTDEQLAALMRSDVTWQQNGGIVTASPADDTYASQARSDAPYTVTALAASTTTAPLGAAVIITATVEDASGAPVTDGVLVTFATDLGHISARAATENGRAVARLTSDTAGTAHVTATTHGSGGPVQQSFDIAFVNAPPTPTLTPTSTPTVTFTPTPTATPTPIPTFTPTPMPEPQGYVLWLPLVHRR